LGYVDELSVSGIDELSVLESVSGIDELSVLESVSGIDELSVSGNNGFLIRLYVYSIQREALFINWKILNEFEIKQIQT
jgi:hypothetical protein